MKHANKSPWAWIPSLYFAEGLPNIVVVTLSVVMYKNLGLPNADIAFYTSLIYLPWVIKPLWSPFVDLLKTKRWWITTMQLLIGGGLVGIALCIPLPFYVLTTLVFFWLIAFSSATHDIAADGFYMLALNSEKQAFFVGIRSIFYRLAVIFGQGALVFAAGFFAKQTGSFTSAWSLVFFLIAVLFVVFHIYHRFSLPHPPVDKPHSNITSQSILREFGVTFKTFFTKKHALAGICFMLTYRFSEAQLLKLIQPFLLDPIEKGGLGLSNEQLGLVYGTLGTLGLIIGGVVGGIAAAKGGLKKWLWPMMLSMLLSSITFVYLSFVPTNNLWIIGLCTVIEQFGYGLGFTAYILFLMYYSEGEHKTAHYAICTGFMALGLLLPGLVAGWIQEQIGYQNFFLWVMVCSIVPIISACFLRIDASYGKTKNASST